MTKEEKALCKKTLQSFKGAIDCDDIKVKEKIKQILIDNKLIIYALNNKELEEDDAEPEDYFNVNIKPLYMIPETQSSVKNFLCYEVKYDMAQSFQYSKSHNSLNNTVKNMQVIFYILCEDKDIIDRDTGIPRHDLLAALVVDQFNWSTEFGSKLLLVSDVPSVTDTHYACRTLTFEQITDNNVIKTVDGVPRFVNKINQFRELTHNGETDN